MNCQQAREQFWNPTAEVEGHLAGCPACAAEVESLHSLWNRMGALPEEDPSPALRPRFYAMLEGYRQGQAVGQTPPWWQMLLPRPALQAALAALLLGCGALLGYLAAGKARDGEELISLRQEMHGMRQLVTLSLLQQQSASERLEGVSWSRRLERPDPEVQNALFDALRHDQSINVRLAALEALRPLAAQEPVRRQLMDSLSAQPSPLVQISLIDLMVEIRERKAVEALRRISTDENANPTVRKRAGWGLQQLGGL